MLTRSSSILKLHGTKVMNTCVTRTAALACHMCIGFLACIYVHLPESFASAVPFRL